MHIPDGYLSPSTCALLYGTAIPFWYMAFARVKRLLNTRLIPLLAVASAFCFVIMMFNVPLPGGTTGHAVGVGAATVVLGPWASMLSVSIALLIQAVFFGDGGITTFGANCFNMAIVGSLVAHFTYRAVAGRTAITSPRRVVAAGLAGYAAINVAALLTACELGIQPLLFKDASGAPLYAPYALHIAIPAMMLGHLTFAGLAELFVAGGVVAYLQRTNPALLGQKSAVGARKDASAGRGFRLEDDTPALDSSGAAHAPDASRNSGGGNGLGRMGSKRFLRSPDAAANCGCLGPGRASVRTAAGFGPTLFFMECAFSPVCSSLCAPSCFWLCDVSHVRLRPHSWFLLARGLDDRQARRS